MCLAALLGLALPVSEVNAGERKDRREDMNTCLDFGARYGSPQYTDCMLTQQRRRDVKKLESIQRTQMLSQIAKDGQLMAERARRQRCDRNPDRRECR
jgi:hypothetical protein